MDPLNKFNHVANNQFNNTESQSQNEIDDKIDNVSQKILESPPSPTEESFKERMRAFTEEESFMSSSSDVEEWTDSEFEALSTYLSEIPVDSIFADTDLVLLKEDYSGPMPLNGIKESELKRTEELFRDIQAGKMQLEIDKNDRQFVQEIEKDIKKLLTRSLGRKLVSKICQNSKKTFIVKSFTQNILPHYTIEKVNPSYHEKEGKLVHNVNKQCWIIGITSSGKRDLFLLPSYITLGHELIHASFPEELVKRFEIPPTMEKEYDSLEEQVVITGLSKHLSFLSAEEGELKTNSQDEEEWEPWIEASYQELNERNLTAAFTSRPSVFYARVGHSGLTEQNDDLKYRVRSYRITAHPIQKQQIDELQQKLSQMKDLPAPVDFIVDCFLWLNTLTNQPRSIQTLDSLLNSLNAFKTIDPTALSVLVDDFNDLKFFGDWKQEEIDQTFIRYFKVFKRRALDKCSNSIPKECKPIFDRLFKRYIDDFNQSTQILILTEKEKNNIQEELFDYLMKEESPLMNSSTQIDDDGNVQLTIDNYHSFLRLLFVKKTEYKETEELICHLIKSTKYFLDPSHFQLTFLQKLSNFFGSPAPRFNRLISFFEPALQEVLKNFLRQLAGEQEALAFLLFEDLFNQPKMLMQEFRDNKRNYTYIFLNYLSTHPEKVSSLASEQQKHASQLIEKLKNLQ